MLLTADVLGILVAYAVTQALFDRRPAFEQLASLEMLMLVASLPAWIVGAKLFGLYDGDEERTDNSTVDDLVRVFLLATVAAFLLTQFKILYDGSFPDPSKTSITWVLTIGLISSARAVARSVSRRHPAYLQNTVIAGTDDIGRLVARKILKHPEYGINLLGFVDGDANGHRDGLDGIPVVGRPEQLPQIVDALDLDRVIVAFSSDSDERLLAVVRLLRDSPVQIDIVPRLFEAVGPRAVIHSLEGLPLVGLPRPRLSRSSALLKRTLDLVGALASLLVLAPLFAVAAAAIKWDSPGPVFFRQIRVGNGARAFRIFKFRTMIVNAEARKHEYAHLNKHACEGGDPRMFKIPSDPRTTRVGRFLRRYSLDELPQLINVVKGEMTLVGPRPLIPEEHVHVYDWAQRRCILKPGMTGLWQVLGRDDISFEEMMKLDYLYVIDWSLLNDIKLMLRTVPVLFRRRGVH